MNASEDERCIQKVLDGNARAYAFLVDKYQSLAYTIAFRILKQEQEAEEASQDAFVKAYRALGAYQGQAAFSTWLYRIVYNTALSRLRKQQLTITSLNGTHDESAASSSPDATQTLEQQDRRAFIERALQKLPGDEAALVDLFYIQEKDTVEIEAITGLTRVNVRTKLFRARKKLYQYLQTALKHGKEDLL